MADAHANVASAAYDTLVLELSEHTNGTRQAHAHAYHTLVQRIKMTTNGYMRNYSYGLVMHEVEQVKKWE